jgi:hypothetical protein
LPTVTEIPHRLFQQPWPEGEYRMFQLGFFVDDALAEAGRWARVFAVGPFRVRPRMEAPCIYRGVASAIDMQVALAQAGPVQIELIQQFCDRPSVYRDMPRAGGSFLHQLCTVTPDYEGTKAYYTRLGYELACEFPEHHVAYFDTLADFGFFTEVVDQYAGFFPDWEMMADTCSTWDGRDPVRILTADGYRTP